MKPKKIDSKYLELINGNDNVDTFLRKEFIKKTIKSFDNLIIEGLKRKGYEFKNHLELTKFIKERCKCTDNILTNEKVYYVDDTPFFLHKYKNDFEINNPIENDNSVTMSIDFGEYAFI